MPSADYYRKQAQLCASMAVASSDPAVVARYKELALDLLARADEIEPLSAQMHPAVSDDGGSDMDRD